MLNIINDLSRYGEIIAGDEKERKIVNKLKELFEDTKADQIIVTPINVVNWKEKYVKISCGNYEVPAIALVYSPSGTFNFKNSSVIEFRSSFVQLNLDYNTAINKNTEGVIFTKDNILRRFTLTYGVPLQHFGLPPKVPAIYVRNMDIQKLNESCEITVETSINTQAIGYIIEARYNSRFENPIFITAHHDHFFNGDIDDLLGLALLSKLPQLVSENNKQELRLISFTAHESGSPFYTFFWSYGAQAFIKNVNLANENPSACISIDSLTKNFKIYGSPFMNSYTNNYLGRSDCYPFMKSGIISFAIGDFEYDYAHSEYDRISDKMDLSYVNNVIELLEKLISSVSGNFKNLLIYDKLIEYQKELPLELKSYFTNIIDNIDKVEVYKELLKTSGIIAGTDINEFYLEPFYRVTYLKRLLKNKVGLYAEDYFDLSNLLHDYGQNSTYLNHIINSLLTSESKNYLKFIYNIINQNYT